MEGAPEALSFTRRLFYPRGGLYRWRGRDRGGNMRHELEVEHTVECSGRIILVCKKCWETTILLGLEEDWLSERRTDFTCGCGQNLTLEKDRESEEVVSVRRLLRGTTKLSDSGGGEDYRGPGKLA